MQENQINNRAYEEDEIDLRELFQTLIKNKMKIISITFVITILAIIWAISRTEIYEVKSNVQIGFIGKNTITDPETLVKIAKLVFNVDDKVDTKKEFISEVSSISTNKKIKNFLEIKTEAISNDEALKKNKEVVTYIKNKYINIINQFINTNNNKIKLIKDKIKNLEDLERKNIERKIKLLKTQAIVKINEKIKFYSKMKMNSLEKKIKFQVNKLKKYTKAVTQIYQNDNKTKDTTALTISSIQLVNYQNLILNSQNRIEDLKLEVENLKVEIIPNLQREKQNLQNDTLRKLEYKLKIELPNKKVKLLEQIEELKFQNSIQNIQNSKVIGSYFIKDNPIKPKKKLIVIVAFVTSLILSIFLVFFLEFIRGFKEETK